MRNYHLVCESNIQKTYKEIIFLYKGDYDLKEFLKNAQLGIFITVRYSIFHLHCSGIFPFADMLPKEKINSKTFGMILAGPRSGISDSSPITSVIYGYFSPSVTSWIHILVNSPKRIYVCPFLCDSSDIQIICYKHVFFPQKLK